MSGMDEDREKALLASDPDSPSSRNVDSRPPQPPGPRPVANNEPLPRSAKEEAEDIAFAANALMTLVKPVVITMILATFMIVHLTSTSDSSSGTGVNGYLVSDEEGSQNEGDKFEAALFNALVFVAAIIVVTFLLLICYKYNWLKAIVVWLVLSVAALLFMSGGFVVVRALYVMDARVDQFTFYLVMYNFAIVGVLSVFTEKLPHVLKQGYLIIISAIMAFLLSLLPEWTTWIFLFLLAIYDLCAVLTPCGPLKCLIDLSQERDDPIPALLYEAKTVVPNPRRNAAPTSQDVPLVQRGPTAQERKEAEEAEHLRVEVAALRAQVAEMKESEKDEAQTPPPSTPDWHDEDIERRSNGKQTSSARNTPPQTPSASNKNAVVAPSSSSVAVPASGAAAAASGDEYYYDEEEPEDKSVKLGLGDFVMYSLLVGRAASFGMATFTACFVAILAGLGLTLVCLAVLRKALPALPFSIFFAMFFYFTTRGIVWPFIEEFISYPMTI